MRLVRTLCIVFVMIVVFGSTSFADNPIVQTRYTSDPAPLVYDDTLYVYTGHDAPGATYFEMSDWRVYSTTDMVNWTDHGSAFDPDDFSWASPGDAWAAQCVERDGKFYFYVTATHRNLNRPVVGVAVSDSPTGPFVDPIGKPLAAHVWGDIDPTVFIDDDGQAYMYWGNPNLWYVKLNEDMVSYDQSVGVVRVPLTEESFGKRHGNPERATLYEEGPWLYKRDDIYYMIYAASGIPENIAYSTGPSATGPWTFGGIIMPTEGRSFTNHPGVVDYKGNSYFFYHNGALPGGGGFSRSVAVEEFEFNPDGTFPTIRMTQAGPSAIANLNPYQKTAAVTIAWAQGVKTESNSEGRMNVHEISDGNHIKVKNVDFGETGAGTFSASVASGSRGGSIEIRLDSLYGEIIGTLPISYTGGWDEWRTKSTAITGATGVRDLFFIFRGEEEELFKFDFWMFEERSNTSDLVAINATIEDYKTDIKPGMNTLDMKVTALYGDGTTKDVTNDVEVVASQSGVVEVSGGIITGIQYNTIDLDIVYGEKSDTLTIVVSDLESELTVSELTLNETNFDMYIGTTAPLTVTAEYLDGHIVDVTGIATYENSDPDVASVYNGNIIAKAVGVTDIDVSFKGELGETVMIPINVTVSNRNPYVRNEAELMSDHRGVDTEDSSEGGQNVGFIENGDWIMFSSLDFGSGAATFEARVASANSGGTIELRLDSPNGPLVGSLDVEGTGGWQDWVTRTTSVSDAAGVHDLYLVFTGGSGYLMNINWWQFYQR